MTFYQRSHDLQANGVVAKGGILTDDAEGKINYITAPEVWDEQLHGFRTLMGWGVGFDLETVKGCCDPIDHLKGFAVTPDGHMVDLVGLIEGIIGYFQFPQLLNGLEGVHSDGYPIKMMGFITVKKDLIVLQQDLQATYAFLICQKRGYIYGSFYRPIRDRCRNNILSMCQERPENGHYGNEDGFVNDTDGVKGPEGESLQNGLAVINQRPGFAKLFEYKNRRHQIPPYDYCYINYRFKTHNMISLKDLDNTVNVSGYMLWNMGLGFQWADLVGHRAHP